MICGSLVTATVPRALNTLILPLSTVRGYMPIQGMNADVFVVDYKSAVEWIRQQIDSDPARYKHDDTRFWVDVPAI